MSEDGSVRATKGLSGDDTVALPLGASQPAQAGAQHTAASPPGAAAGADTRSVPARVSALPPRSGRSDRAESRVSAGRPATRRARLSVRKVDPWSVFVLAFLVSIFLAVVLVVAATALYAVLDGAGVLSSVNSFAQELALIGPEDTVISGSRVLAVAAIAAGINIVVLTLLSTVAAVLYNVCASFTGGLELTLSERE